MLRPSPRQPAVPRLPWRYLRSLLRELVLTIALMLLAVEALYLSDKLITHLLYDMLRNALGAGFLLETMLLAVPEIMSVGFPLAALIAIYLVLLRRRDAGDLVILAGGGVGPGVLVVLCLGLGGVTAATSIALRFHLEPLSARYLAQRLTEARFDAVRSGRLTEGQFLTLGSMTFYRHPQADPTGGSVFAFLAQDGGIEQVVTAASLRLDYDPGGSSGALALESPLIVEFSRGEGQQRNQTIRVSLGTLQISPMALNLDEIALPPVRPNHATLRDLLRDWQQPQTPALHEMIRRVLGVAVAFLAPLLAGVALVATRGGLVFVALPLAMAVVLGGTLIQTPLAGILVALGPAAVWVVSGSAALLALGLGLVIWRLTPGCLLPQQVRL